MRLMKYLPSILSTDIDESDGDLIDDYNIQIGKKKTMSLMKKMGLQAFYPKKKPNTSTPNSSSQEIPISIEKSNNHQT